MYAIDTQPNPGIATSRPKTNSECLRANKYIVLLNEFKSWLNWDS